MAIHLSSDAGSSGHDTYLLGRGAAWFAFAMTFALMLIDYIDRQVIVSLFPYIKAEWSLSDGQLGSMVSVVSVTVALGATPIALLADRTSRVKSIAVMAGLWSLASIASIFTRNYAQLFAVRALVGLGEAGYGTVGGALIASLFPARLRGALMASFFAAAALGSVMGVLIGSMIAARWGWKAAFGVVGIPGLVLALIYLKVRDYKTIALTPALDAAAASSGSAARFIVKAVVRSRTMLWVCLGAAAQLIVVSAVWSWLPSFLNRYHGVPAAQAGTKAALVVLVSAFGSVVWGNVIDRNRQTSHEEQVDRAGAAVPRRDGDSGADLRVDPFDFLQRTVCPDRSRRFPHDLQHRSGGCNRDRRPPSRRSRYRRIGSRRDPESVRPGCGTRHHRHAVGRLWA